MSLSAKIETTANAATVVAAVLLSIVLVKAYLLPHSIAPTVIASAPEVVQGKSVDAHLLGVDWSKNHRTLVLAISTTCHFCKDSIPFYRKLGASGADVKMVAVLPQSVSEGKAYLSGEGVRVDGVRQVPLNKLGVRGTPTLLLVDEAGVVTDVWVGKLQPDQENQVLTAIEKKIAGLAPDHATP
ncbi:MAG: TlpA family protein disulfide reductase [Candidatus Acidiferrum sp.]